MRSSACADAAVANNSKARNGNTRCLITLIHSRLAGMDRLVVEKVASGTVKSRKRSAAEGERLSTIEQQIEILTKSSGRLQPGPVFEHDHVLALE